jgi:hypothetical protein|tara:strand:- start:851 stop:1138 length:288 start_codon:yes stop_codon:yes gene_type:complete
MANWKKKSYSSMARNGRKNGRWKDGSSQTHYRNKSNAPKGKIVHHIDGNKSNNSKSNIRLVSKSEHNKEHPEKGGRRKCKSGFTWSKKAKTCVKL